MIDKLLELIFKLDQTSFTIVFVASVIFVLIVLSSLFNFLKNVLRDFSDVASSEEKKTLVKRGVDFLFSLIKKKDGSADKAGNTIIINNGNSPVSPPLSGKDPNLLEVSKTIESSEVIIMIQKVVRFKEAESSLEKEFMVRCMKTVENSMTTGFDSIIRTMFFQSNPDYYKENMEELKMVAGSVSRQFIDSFRQIILRNHLEQYTNHPARKVYIEEKVGQLIKELSDKMTNVMMKLAQAGNNGGEFLSFLETTAFAKEIHYLFEELLIKLIEYAIGREDTREEMKEKLKESITSSSEALSESAISIIRDLLRI